MIVTVKGARTTYNLEMERGGKRSDHSCAKGAGTTYFLEVEREGKRSDHSCDCKGSRDDAHTGGGEGGKTSGHGCNYKGSRDDILSGGGEGGQEVRSWLQLQREQGQHTYCRWRGGERGQIMVVTAEGGGTTYSLGVERC